MQIIKASDDTSSIQNSNNTVRQRGKASSNRKVIGYFCDCRDSVRIGSMGSMLLINSLKVGLGTNSFRSFQSNLQFHQNLEPIDWKSLRNHCIVCKETTIDSLYCSLIRDNKRAAVTKQNPAVRKKIAKINWTKHSPTWTKRTTRLNGRGFKRSWTSKTGHKDHKILMFYSCG